MRALSPDACRDPRDLELTAPWIPRRTSPSDLGAKGPRHRGSELLIGGDEVDVVGRRLASSNGLFFSRLRERSSARIAKYLVDKSVSLLL